MWTFAGLPALILPLALWAGPASAQPVPNLAPPDCIAAPEAPDREIRAGMCVRSTLGAGDETLPGEVRYEDFRLPLEENQTVQIDMESIDMYPEQQAGRTAASVQQSAPQQTDTVVARGFDTYLELRRAGSARALAENDDRPDSLNSRLVFTAPAAGDYVVRARALSSGVGDYVLRVRTVPSPPRPIPMSRDEVGETLAASSPESPRPGYRYAVYEIEGRRDELIGFELTLDEGLGVLTLRGPEGDIVTTGSGARIEHLLAFLPQTGRYLMTIEAPVRDQPNRYTLRLERRAAGERPPEEPRPIRPGETVEAALDIHSDFRLQPDGSRQIDFFYRLYALPVRAGEVLTVDLEHTGPAPNMDPVLDAGMMSVLGFASAASDDDGGDVGLNSRLVLRPEGSGTVLLRVRSLGPRPGSYRLRVAPGAAPAAAD